MALKIGDRVRENTSSTGIGGLSLTGATAGFQTFDSVLSSGDITYYTLEENDKFEVGIGTYGSNNLERTAILSSSNSGDRISLGGSGVVFITYPASKALFKNENDQFVLGASGIQFASGNSLIGPKIVELIDVGLSGTPSQNTVFDLNITNKALSIGDMTGATNLSNILIGYGAASGIVNAQHNVVIGSESSGMNKSGSRNVYIGSNSGPTGASASSSVYESVVVGCDAGDLIRQQSTVMGYTAGTSSYEVGLTSIGYKAGENVGSYSTTVGYQAGTNLTDDYPVCLGYRAGYNSSGMSSVWIGKGAGTSASSSMKSIGIGNDAGKNSSSSHCIYIGDSAGGSNSIDDLVFIGNASPSSNGTLIKGDMSNKRVAIGAADVTLDDTLFVAINSQNDEGIVVKGAVSQSSNLTSWKNSSDGVMASVSADGIVSTNGIRATGNGVQIDNATPDSTSSKLYAVGTDLYWNGSILSDGTSVTMGDLNYVSGIAAYASGHLYNDAYVSGVAVYSSGQSISNQSSINTNTSNISNNVANINYVSGIAVYASGRLYDDAYVSGVAVYSSGQAIANESDIATNTSNISTNTGRVNYASGQAIANESDIAALLSASGTATSLIASSGIANYASGQAVSNQASISTNASNITYVSGVATNKFVVTAADSSNYTIDGMGLNSATDPVIYLHKGHTYYFDKQTSSHPFRVSTSNGGSAYQDADGNNIEISGQGVLKFEVPQDAPDKLYYYCTSHASMNGVIYTTNNVDEIIHVSGIAAYASGQAISNQSNIGTNTSNISTNTSNISTNTARVNYASGQAIQNETDIFYVSGVAAAGGGDVGIEQLNYVSGIAVYASGHSGGGGGVDVYTSGVASYASGQAIANETDILYVSGVAAAGGSSLSAGSGILVDGASKINVYGGSGNFQELQVTSDNVFVPKIIFTGSGAVDTPITLETRSSYESASGSGSALLFQGTQGQLFSITDNLSSGVIFSVADIAGLPLIEADASGDVKLGEFGRYVGVGSGVPQYGLDISASGRIQKGVVLSSYVPAVTTNTLYNEGGTLKFNGSSIGGGGVDTYTSGVATYASGQAIENEGLVTYASGNTIATQAIANYASGQAIANETDILYVSGVAAAGGSSLTAGSGVIVDGASKINIHSGTGNFQEVQLTSTNTFTPKMIFTGSGIQDTPVTLKVLSSHASVNTSGTALSFEGTQGQLFGITDNLSSGNIFTVNDITGLPLISADASGDVKIGQFGRYVGIGTGVPLYGFDVSSSGQLQKGVILSDYVPATTTNALYNDGGTLKFNGSAVGGVDTYTSGVATYASGQAIENEADILYVSGIAVYASGNTLQRVTDNGASTTNAITITDNNITASSGLFDALDMTPLGNGSAPAYQEGVVFYDSENHTLSLYNDEADVTLQLGQEQFLRVRNNTGATIGNGTAVLINGVHGNAAPTISGAIATSEANSQAIGLATHSIEDGSFGYVTTYGIVRDIDTSEFSAGDEVFLSATQIGSGVSIAPTIPNYKISLGHVINSASSNGSILVQVGNTKLGGGDLKSEAPLNMSGVPFVTSISDTTAGGSQTDPLFVFDSGNRQLQLASGVQLLDGAPTNTSNVLYNEGGTLKFNGSAVDTTYSAGSGINIDAANKINVYGGTGNFQDIQLTTDNAVVPKMVFTGSGVDNSPITLRVESNFQSATGSGTALLFEGEEGVLFSVTDNLSSGVIFNVTNDLGLPLLEVEAHGDVKIGENASGIILHQPVLISGGVPTDTTNKLYNDAGTLKFNGSSIGGVDVYTSGVATYASGNTIATQAIANYASGQAIENEGLATYASGQAIANETDILYVSGVAASAGTVQGTDATYDIQPTNEGATTGNTRGESSVDLQTNRNAATQVASATTSTISGGARNTASGSSATVSGGYSNAATGDYSSIGGGQSNTASGSKSTVSGGDNNTASAYRSTVVGGHNNAASNSFATISGGVSNTASGHSSTAGGNNSTASGAASTVGGGQSNDSTGGYSTVSGGYQNTASGTGSVVAGGGNNGPRVGNTASGGSSSVLGGHGNTASGYGSSVGGGIYNTASASYSTVGGGRYNTASADSSTVIGGRFAKSVLYGGVAHAAGLFSSHGDAQHLTLVARDSTTDATANQVMFLNGSSERLVIPAETTWMFTIKLAAHNDTNNDGGWWYFRGGIARDGAGNTALIGSVTSEYSVDSNISTATAEVVADDTNDALEIRVTGVASKNIRWVAVVDISQVSWGTP